ncbi:CpaF family protein [Desulfoscipio geothermicus]|uniref:Pilus assembly protein CpaF n=1 Tax=Desulfoscipio geothermicus DSM 3669 TaxID=1121426 RepID=A0A1I6DNL4_9FIRM|nr:ATPase, T2SS/T4P/T4SS family [Desulfoscipio geothermicus]SFR07024.1 pilus assembly protein CpaF [Desulfoscipio geothermicus DSM 3669]
MERSLPGTSDILRQRRQKETEDKIYGHMEEVVEGCRQHILNLYKKGQELDGNQLEDEISNHLTQNRNLSYTDRVNIARQIRNELAGYGPLQELMDNATVTDIVVTDYDKILYEQDGELIPATGITFRSKAHLRLFVERLCYLGRCKIDESTPSVSLTLPEGHRVAVSIPPLGDGVYLAIRKFVYIGNIDSMVPATFSAAGALFLKLAAKGRLNVMITGPMGAGKTTLIAVLGHEFDQLELPVLVEEVRECPLKHPYLRNYVARQPNIEGKGEIGIGTILKHALQTRATRILIAEVRDGAIFYLLRAMATGQSGMGTLHSETPLDTVRVQIPMLMGQSPEAAGMDQATRNLIISSAIDLIVQMGKEYDPATQTEKRVCTHISEVQISNGEPVETKDIFVRRGDEMVPTGYIPRRALEKMARRKISVPQQIFTISGRKGDH